MWTFRTMMFYSAMQNSSKTWRRRWQKVDKIKTIIKFKDCSKCPPFARTQALSLLCHWTIAMSTCQGRTKLQSASASVRRWCGFSSGIHDAAWQSNSRNQLHWDLDCSEATNLEKWSLVFLDTEPPQFYAHNVQVRPWTVTLVLVLQSNVATKLNYGVKFFILVMSHFFLIPTLKEFKKSTNICQSNSKKWKWPSFFNSQCIFEVLR